jgi:hypothetical protein
MIATTLNRIRSHNPCEPSWVTLLSALGKTKADDEPLPYARIVQICGLDDALWATRAAPEYAKEWRLYAVACARHVVHLSPDPRVAKALTVAERYAHGQATDEELEKARKAVRRAFDEAESHAAWAKSDVVRHAWAVAQAAAWAARETTIRDVIDVARYAANAAALALAYQSKAAKAAEREWQKQAFLEIVGGTQ